MADDIQDYFDSLSDQLAAQLSDAIREQAELLSAAQRQRLKELEQFPDETGHLEESCVVVATDDPLTFIVQAGGDLTTRYYDRSTDYESEVIIDGRDNDGIAKRRKGSGEGVEYDYADGFEFGTSKQPARPFFFNTYEETKPDMQDAINKAIEKALK